MKKDRSRKPDLRNFTYQELIGIVKEEGYTEHWARRLFACLYREKIYSWDQICDIPSPLRLGLMKKYSMSHLVLSEKQTSKLDGTVKLLFRLHDGNFVESVILYSGYGVSLCISSQVGCKCGCSFCATAEMGFIRNLQPSEILGQFLAAQECAIGTINNIVFMGMGEPFLNWENVKKSILVLVDDKGIGFARSRITVSTVGIVPVIKKFINEKLGINLAISLITADAKQRMKLVPMNRKYPLSRIMRAVQKYGASTGRAVFIEYILFDNVNDSPADATKLIKKIGTLHCKINLIVYNRVPGKNLAAGRKERVLEFQRILISNGLRTYRRRERGSDIAAACGQLAGKKEGVKDTPFHVP